MISKRQSEKLLRTREPLILFFQLVERWTGAVQRDVLEQDTLGKLKPFILQKTLILPDGTREYWLLPTVLEVNDWNRKDALAELPLVFLEKNILEIEKSRSDFLRPSVRWADLMRERGFISDEQENQSKEGEEVASLAAMEAALGQERAANEKLRQRVAELENMVLRGGEGAQEAEDFPEEYEGHGIFTVVAKLVDARAPVPEIMAAIDNEQEFLSQREVGYFFHPSPQGKGASALRNYTKRKKARD